MRSAEFYQEFATFYTAHRAGVFALLYSRTGNWHDAEDLTHKIFVEVLEKWKEFRARTEAQNRVYIYREMVKGKSVDMFRAAERTRKAETKAERQAEQVRKPQDPLDQVMRSQVMHSEAVRWLRTLPDRQRQVAILHFWEDMKVAEISEVLGISASTVGTIKQRIVAEARATLWIKVPSPEPGETINKSRTSVARANALIKFLGAEKRGGPR